MTSPRAAAVGGFRTLAVAILASAAITACASEPRTTYGPPGGPAGALTDATESVVIAALGGVGLAAAEAQLPYRPSEGALLANAPRTVLQVTLPEDPTNAFIVIYSLLSPQAADAAAAGQAELISSNRGGAFPNTSRFSRRVVGSTVVFFTWIPETVIDPREALIEEALLSVGSEVPIAP
jgi:hypothetical protein